MSRIILSLCLTTCFFFPNVSHPALAGTILFEATDLADTTPGQDLWQYRYRLSGFAFGLNSGFDIFFPVSDGYLFGDLENDPPEPNADWSVLSLQPDPGLPDDGVLDALALVNNPSLVDAFTVQFIWRGTGTPGAQPFTIFDDTFAVIGDGLTVAAGGTPIPEPGTFLFLATGLGLLAWQRRRMRTLAHPRA